MADRQASSSVHPYVQARRMVQATDGERFLDAFVDADLNAVGLPPVGLAAVGGHPAGVAWDCEGGALDVALWLALVLTRFGLLAKVRALYASTRSARGPAGHVWQAGEPAGRALALALGDALTTEAGDPLDGLTLDGPALVRPARIGTPSPLTLNEYAAAVPACVWFAGVAKRAGVADVLRPFFERRPHSEATPWRQVAGLGAVSAVRSDVAATGAALAAEVDAATVSAGGDDA